MVPRQARRPTAQQLADINTKLEELATAITEHPKFEPSSSGGEPMLYHLWDFVKRSQYMLSEYDNIKAGRPVQHPEQLRGAVGVGNQAALKVYQEVCASTMMMEMMIGGAMGTGNIDYGTKIKDGVKAVKEVCPEDAVMAE